MKTTKYTAKIVNVKWVYISNDTCQIAENVTFEDSTINYFNNTNKYSYVALFTPLLTITGNTYKELNGKVDQYVSSTGNYDVSVIMIKK